MPGQHGRASVPEPIAVCAVTLAERSETIPREVMTHPISAILPALAGRVALFSDFDGTLVDIAPHPDAIQLPPDLENRLTRLDAQLEGAFAIVTGRAIDAMDHFISTPLLSIAGSHGAEWRHAGKRFHAAPDHAHQAGEIAAEVRRALGEDSRILIETKPSGVAIHYRAAAEREAEAHGALASAIAHVTGFQMITGKKVVEARPDGTDKGTAVETFMKQVPFAGRRPVFIGDDTTDEDGFLAAERLGGMGIKVGTGATQAQFRLPDVSSVHGLIDAIIGVDMLANDHQAKGAAR